MLGSARNLFFSRNALRKCTLFTENNLCVSMQRLSISSDRSSFCLNNRTFNTSATVLQQKFHLDTEGAIKEHYLNQRRKFLKKHQLRQDQVIFQNRIVYENRHLYDVNYIDRYGLTNLQRMLKGLAPISSNGEDCLVLHHFDQTHKSEWVVLLSHFHEEHDLLLHSHVKVKNGVNRQLFAKERMAYWQHVANTHLLKKAISGIRKK